MTWRVVVAVVVAVLCASAVGAQPTVRCAGEPQASQGAIVGLDICSAETNDLLLLFCESNEAITTPDGWTAAPDAPVVKATAPAARLSVFYRVATSDDTDGECLACSVADPGNHLLCAILVLAGADTSTPFDVSATSDSGASASKTVTGDTATQTTTLVVAAIGAANDKDSDPQFDSWANTASPGGCTSLGSVTGRISTGTNLGDDGALGVATGTLATATRWCDTSVTGPAAGAAHWAANVRVAPPVTNTPTPVNTATVTQTPTVTNTPTITNTPTVTATPTTASGCYRVTFTPAASADDVRLRQTNATPPAALTTNETTIQFGSWDFFGLDFEDMAALRFHTAPTIPDDATVTAAWLALYTVTASTSNPGGLREFLGQWTGNQGAWAVADFESPLSPATAFQFPFPSDIGSADRYYTIPLAAPENVDIDTSYTGLKLGATYPGAPTASDSIVWTFQSVDGANPPVLHVEYCDPTPTPTATVTRTATNTATSTATVTNTPTVTRTPAACDKQATSGARGRPSSCTGPEDEFALVLTKRTPGGTAFRSDSVPRPFNEFYDANGVRVGAGLSPHKLKIDATLTSSLDTRTITTGLNSSWLPSLTSGDLAGWGACTVDQGCDFTGQLPERDGAPFTPFESIFVRCESVPLDETTYFCRLTGAGPYQNEDAGQSLAAQGCAVQAVAISTYDDQGDEGAVPDNCIMATTLIVEDVPVAVLCSLNGSAASPDDQQFYCDTGLSLAVWDAQEERGIQIGSAGAGCTGSVTIEWEIVCAGRN